MTVLNVIDRRKRKYRFLKVNAIIEPTWHDNSLDDSDKSHPDGVKGAMAWMGYDEKERVSVQEAFEWASKHPDDVTLYLYDEDAGLYVTFIGEDEATMEGLTT